VNTIVARVAAYASILLCIPICYGQVEAPPSLFKTVDKRIAFGEQNQLTSALPRKRARLVQVEMKLINQDSATETLHGQSLAFGSETSVPLTGMKSLKKVQLNLFENVLLVADFRKVSISEDRKTVIWSGTIDGMKYGQIALAATGGTVSGNVSTDSGAIYQILPAPDGVGNALVLEVDQTKLPKDGQPVRVELPSGTAADEQPGGDDGSVIDVMVAYTAKAKAAAGGDAAITTLINLGIDQTNQGYANSGVIQRVRLVHTVEVNYDESSGFADALARLSNPTDGYMDEIHALRDRFGADLVSLWISNGNSGTCGLAYLMDSPSAVFQSKAFSVVAVQCATTLYSFGHEMGHNQGCQHDRVNANSAGAYPYSYGLQRSPYFRTIEAYDCAPISCIRLNNWSNPDVRFGGQPTGVPAAQAQPADDRNTLNNTRRIAARWRRSTVPISSGTMTPQ
jgi:hypothetical protein